MPTFAKFNQYGGLVYKVATSDPAGLGDDDLVQIPDDCDVNNIYRHPNGAVGPRIEIELICDRTVLNQDGSDSATISSLPRGCTLEVNGAPMTAADGKIVLSSTGGDLVIKAAGAFFSQPLYILALSMEEMTEMVREKRNQLLAESDWTQTLDASLSASKKEEWLQYRLALRDITDTQPNANIDTVVWPEKP